MNKLQKLSLLVSFALLVSMPTLAQSDFSLGGYILKRFSRVDSTCTLGLHNPSFFKKSTSLKIPAQIIDNETLYTVVEIGASMCKAQTGIVSVYIPNTIKKIGNDAFAGCSNLETVIMEDEVKEIGNHAFFYCEKLNKVLLSNRLEKIGYMAFLDCKELNTLFLPTSIVEIGHSAFPIISNVGIGNKYTMEYFLNNNNKFSELYIASGYKDDVIPSSTRSNALKNNKNLQIIVCHSEVPIPWQGSETDFSQKQYKNVVIIVPKGSIDAYKNADIWKNFNKIIEGD